VENENYLKDVISVVGGNAALGMRRVFHIRCSLDCALGMRLVPPDQQGMQDPWVGSDLTLNCNDSDSSTMYSTADEDKLEHGLVSKRCKSPFLVSSTLHLLSTS